MAQLFAGSCCATRVFNGEKPPAIVGYYTRSFFKMHVQTRSRVARRGSASEGRTARDTVTVNPGTQGRRAPSVRPIELVTLTALV